MNTITDIFPVFTRIVLAIDRIINWLPVVDCLVAIIYIAINGPFETNDPKTCEYNHRKRNFSSPIQCVDKIDRTIRFISDWEHCRCGKETINKFDYRFRRSQWNIMYELEQIMDKTKVQRWNEKSIPFRFYVFLSDSGICAERSIWKIVLLLNGNRNMANMHIEESEWNLKPFMFRQNISH